jgi:hypothetical protein
MANSFLTTSYMANIGLFVGMELGFTACRVFTRVDGDTFKEVIWFVFGDQERMRSESVHDSHLSYATDAPCIRNQTAFALPAEVRAGLVDHLRSELTERLLEAIPSGPRGVSDLYLLTESPGA